MPIHFLLPKKFTRAQIEWRVDELALQFQGTKNKKLLQQIAALNRLLARMDDRDAHSSKPINRQYLETSVLRRLSNLFGCELCILMRFGQPQSSGSLI